MTGRESEGLRVLLVEDDEDDYLIIDEMLADQDRVRFAAEDPLSADRRARNRTHHRPGGACPMARAVAADGAR
jgi:hypothetical protein